jgi:uncharacterized protein (TIGR03437 family)
MRWVLFFLTARAIAGSFTTYIGTTYPYNVSAVATDAASNTYIVGSRAYNATGNDIFVTKLDPTGAILFTDVFGGNGNATGNAITLDPSGNIYIGGTTTANDFPLSKPLQKQSSSFGTGFILKLSNDGSTILSSTYFGGAQGPSSISSLATDAKGNLYLTGFSNASDFPQTSGLPIAHLSFGLAAISGAIVAEISAAGDKILYSAAIPGTVPDCTGGSSCFLSMRYTSGAGIALDAAGNAYIAGNTNTLDLPTTPGTLSPKGTGAFVAKIAAGGADLSYLTYVDSGQTEFNPSFAPTTNVNAIAVDASGNAYLAGWTNDPSFPVTPGALQTAFGSGPNTSGVWNGVAADAFFAKLNPSGTAYAWATFLGGTGNDVALSIALDSSQNVWAAGTTTSPNFPSSQGTGGDFLVETNSSGSSLLYSSRFPNGTLSRALAIDPSGFLHVAGATGIVSLIVPGVKPTISILGIQNGFGGSLSGQISPAEVISIYGQQIGPVSPVTAVPTNGFYPTTLGGVVVSINGIDIPLLYVSSTQINAVVPMSAVASTMQVTYSSTTSPAFPLQIVNSTATAYPAVLNQDGTINSQTNPAKAGSIITFYATGFQTNFYPLADGQVATVAHDYCGTLCLVNPPTATIVYGGAAPGIVAGVTQFNVQLPSTPSTYLVLYPFGSLNGQPVAVWVGP